MRKITRNRAEKKKDEPRSISFIPTDDNRDFLNERKDCGVTYNFTVNRAVDLFRANDKAA